MFNSIDVDNNGRIEKSELMKRFVQLNKAQEKDAMDSTEMHLLWNAIDAASSGSMDYQA